jgi:hypothetical protein
VSLADVGRATGERINDGATFFHSNAPILVKTI